MAHSPAVDSRHTRKRIAVVAAACCASHIMSAVFAADTFRRLGSAEIRARVVGKVVTDKSHWSDRFESDGTLRAVDLGTPKPGTWKLEGNDMCVVRAARKAVTECFEIWASGNEVEYRRDGITLTTGVLSNE
jgi:hypothetical protein